MAVIQKPINRAFITDADSFAKMLEKHDKEAARKRKKMAEEFAKNNVGSQAGILR